MPRDLSLRPARVGRLLAAVLVAVPLAACAGGQPDAPVTSTLTAPPGATGPADGGTTEEATRTATADAPTEPATPTAEPSSPQAPPPSSWTPEPIPTVTRTVTVAPAPAPPPTTTGEPTPTATDVAPTATEPPRRPAGTVSGPGWATIVGSYPKGRYSLDAVHAEADRIGGELTVVDSSRTPGMNPGYWAIVAAVSDTEERALAHCADLADRRLQDCYARRLR